jgi:hypothetical protein
MRALDAFHAIMDKLAAPLARARRRSDFVCEDCERWAQCGLPPSEECVFRAEQIARGDWKSKRQMRDLIRMSC